MSHDQDDAVAAVTGREVFFDCGEVKLHAVEAGQGPAILLLHGFPEFWYSWRHLIPQLVSVGFRPVALDLRGYNLSDKPAGVRNYRMDLIVDDLERVIDHLGGSVAAVIGHDWGGIVTWRLLRRRPDLLGAAVVINAPHPAAIARKLRSPGQIARFWYQFFFQIPYLPEQILLARESALLARSLRGLGANRESFTAHDLSFYRRAWSRPGAMTAALNYYRAAYRGQRHVASAAIGPAPPALLIWGEQDPFFLPELVELSRREVQGLEIKRLPAAGHFAHLDEPLEVGRAVLEFLERVGQRS